jgi:hypothetical protein
MHGKFPIQMDVDLSKFEIRRCDSYVHPIPYMYVINVAKVETGNG